jgi:uncharacterized membrane protein
VKAKLQIAFVTLVLAAIAQALWQHGQLPAKVASHFDGAGVPNGWTTRRTHTTLHVATVLFMAALFQGIVALNPRLPREYVNIPRRDYWLTPERATHTHAWLAAMVLGMGCCVLLFFMAVFRLVYRANLTPDPQLDLAIWYYTGALLVAVGILAGATLKRFRRASAT